MQSLIDELVERIRRENILAQTNEAFAALKSKPKAWQKELEERELWDKTLSDGVDD